MSSLTPSTRLNACPICEDSKGRCRQSKHDTDYWQCLTYADTRKGEVIGGFKCIGHTRDNLWAQFRLDNSHEWTAEKKAEWQRENQRRKKEHLKIEAEKKAAALSLQERDKQYRKLLSELSLHPDDRADLLKRGFTNQQINLAGFKSVEQWQKLQAEYSHLLPGVNLQGRSLLSTDAGYACPIRNVEGLIVALQLRIRVVGEGQNRYRWLTSKTKKRPNGQTPHLYPENSATGELPLAVHRPEGKAKGIALAEGTGAKPFLSAQRLNLIVVGAAGGQWVTSSNLFKQALEQLSQELNGTKEISIYPDAGDVKNTKVMRRWKAVVEQLEKWNWTIKFGWWNQINKSDSDIDELENLEGIQYIKPAEFFSISRQHIAQNNIKPLKVESKRKTIQLPEGEEWEFWDKARKFTADLVFEKRWFDTEIPKSGEFLAIKSGLGTGKTYYLITKILKEYAHLGTISIGHRNSLLFQFIEEVKRYSGKDEFYHLQFDLKDTESEILIKDSASKIALCADSLIHFEPEDFEGKLLIIDEVESVVSHLLLADTTVGLFREKVKQRLAEALDKAALVVCLDGHLTDKTIEYLQGLISNPKKLIKIENTYQGNRGKVNFYLGAKAGDKLKTRNYNDFVNKALNNPNKIVIAADSKDKLESIERILAQRNRKTFRFDSSTPYQERARFLKNPVEFLISNQIEVLLYSPSGDAGLSINIQDYFTDLYFLFMGVLTTSSQLQMLGRIRDPQAVIHIYCNPEGLPMKNLGKEVIPEKIQEYALEYQWECAKATLKGISKEDIALELAQKLLELSNDTHFQHETLLKGIEQHERSNLRKCLRLELEKSGYAVADKTTNTDSVNQELKKNSQEIKVERAEKIFSQPNLTWHCG